MPKLNQIVAVEKGVKSRTNTAISNLYKDLQKVAPMAGLTRTYRPKNEDGDRYPSESTLVQIKVPEILNKLSDTMANYVDVVMTKEEGNTQALGNVVVDGTTLISDVPVGSLLMLEKLLQDIHTFIGKIPVLDPSETWTHDPSTGTYKSDTVETAKTKKVPRNHVKAEATDRHPAQVEMYYEDTLVGYWSTTKFSGALPQDTINMLTERVVKLRDAVKVAREEANSIQVDNVHTGEVIMDFLLNV